MRQFNLQTCIAMVLCVAIGFAWFINRNQLLARISSLEEEKRELQVGYLTQQLSPIHHDPMKRLRTVAMLGIVGKTEFIPALIYALKDRDKRVVMEAQKALQGISKKQPVPAQIGMSKFPVPEATVSAWKEWLRTIAPTLDPNFRPSDHVEPAN